ncbi:CAP domain-containing protein [Phosphitispora fastidiosa]|uniref:CAP domain-containing protein n=1 Tax=Phosphitispora fastidiosa TaxID=2837202 RepID=UPI00307CE1FA|nr:putative YkwD family protein [Phosphitispora fastidiosa]
MIIKKLLSLLATTLLLSVTFVSPVFAASIEVPAPNVQSIWNHVQDMINGQDSAPSPATADVPAPQPKPEPQPEPQPVPQPQPKPEPQPEPQQKPVAGQQFSQFQKRVVELVNIERQQEGLQPLSADPLLMKGATAKSQDMVDNGYFSHNSPKYGSPFNMMKTFGISYRYAGENIASGQASPESVVRAWMNSPGHRANIMSSKFNKIGVGYAYTTGGSYHHFWTQWFTS